MKQKFKVRFSLIKSKRDTSSDESQIYLVFRMNGNEAFFYTGYRVKSENFITKPQIKNDKAMFIQSVKKNTYNKSGISASQINRRLQKVYVAANDVYEKRYLGKEHLFGNKEFVGYLLEELGETVKPIEEKQQVISSQNTTNQDFFTYYEKYWKESKVSDARRRHYKADINRLKEYEIDIRIKITFDNLDIVHYKEWLSLDGTRGNNTAVCIMKRLRAFYYYCKKKLKIIKTTPFDDLDFAEEIGTEIYDEPICMDRKELNKLFDYDFKDELEIFVRDCFVLQCCIGARVGDFMRMTNKNIIGNDIVYYPQKTRSKKPEKCVVPLSDRAKTIIAKYKGKGENGLILPFINDVEYNEQLKSISRIAKLNRKIITFDIDTQEEKTCELWETVSTHAARRYFINRLVQSGVPVNIIRTMTGHSEGSRAFSRYHADPLKQKKLAVEKFID